MPAPGGPVPTRQAQVLSYMQDAANEGTSPTSLTKRSFIFGLYKGKSEDHGIEKHCRMK